MFIYDLTVEMGMHAMQPARTFDEVTPSGQRRGIAIRSQVHEGQQVLAFEDRMSSFILCVLYAAPLLQLSNEQIGQLIVELIGLEYSDDQPADYVLRGEQLREALACAEENAQDLFIFFYLYFRQGHYLPVVKFIDRK